MKLLKPHPIRIVSPSDVGLPDGAYRTVISVAPEAKVGFYATTEIHAAGNRPGLAYLARFIKRDDSNWPIVVDQNWCYDRPPAFHAGLQVFSQVLTAYHTQPMKLEGAADQIINVRGLIQGYAKHYNIDPNDIAAQYTHCRSWLGVPHYTHPVTLDGAIHLMEMRSKQKVIH